MEYKDTLLMPKTDFPMRANLAENEATMRKKWEDMNLYQLLQEKNKANDSFVLHDGPPYANGNIHIGHAMNKILKDFINRSKMFEGFKVTYIPGWDVHGLPIETAITSSGVDRKKLTKQEFRLLCEKYALEQIDKQREQFKKLNVIAEWDNPYITMAKEFEAKQIEVFAKMAKRGLIYKGLKPVYWSPSSESALAEAEIEYHDRKDPSIYVAFPVTSGNDKINVDDNLVIWTTTPWTLPGNLAIAAGEEFIYAKVLVNGKNYILSKDLLEELAIEFNWDNYEVVDSFKGTELKGVMYKHVFMDRTSPVVMGYHVTLDAGTGLVHIAPGYGADDFIIGKEFNLGLINGVNDQGYLNEESGIFNGLFFEDANKAVTQKLDELGVLLKLKFITHSYPHDWRTKKPVIFRATNQWFCSINPIRKELLDEIKNSVKWNPSWGELRLNNMIKDRGDWCISRQRVWGVPIPIFYNEDGSEIMDYEVMMHVAKLFGEFGSNVWFEREAKDLLPEGYTNPASPNGNFFKEEDIMDVWFDSGSSHTAVLEPRGLNYPADIYLEGSDQYRGWFNSSLICGVAVHDQAPFKQIVSHGFVLDGKGLKMSKSLGNTVDPLKVISSHGADVLRLWVASVDYTEDVRISDDLMSQVQESYRKIRNTYRFMLGNLSDFEPSKDIVTFEAMRPYDQFLMVRLNEILKDIQNAYTNFDYKEIYKILNSFIAVNLSNFYLDFTKDILYIEGKDSLARRSVQTVIYHVLKTLLVITAPILPYTSEEAYQYMPGDKLSSVHLEENPQVLSYADADAINVKWNRFFEIKDAVYKALEEARNNKLIGKGLEAKVYLKLSTSDLELLTDLMAHLKQLFIVSKVEVMTLSNNNEDNIEVRVEPFNGVKCERCWNYFDEDEMHNDICSRCNDIINK